MNYEFNIRSKREAYCLNKTIEGGVDAVGNVVLTVNSITNFRIRGSTIEEAEYWLDKATEFMPKVLVYNKELNGYQGTAYTKVFLSKGGFTKEYRNQWWRTFREIIPTWVTILISIFSLFVSILAYYRPVHNNGDNERNNRKEVVDYKKDTAGFRK